MDNAMIFLAGLIAGLAFGGFVMSRYRAARAAGMSRSDAMRATIRLGGGPKPP